MKNSKFLFCVICLICIQMLHAQSIQHPSLTKKKAIQKTLIIDSIPVSVAKNYQLTGISNDNVDYRLFFGASRISDYPVFGISRSRPFVAVTRNAFTHEFLFDPFTSYSVDRRNWDNPYNTSSLGAGILAGSLQLLSSFFN
ncbi:hypothetical protein [Aquimarina litoralis]|uniref:hypothetical protein n=1 Tax=Aquimarina litoralis TaxID=584605 RepID=UPI001C565742|nr:hypothetical protein [Aquimarina litoralis]MBW1295352.1 hypothetical protein [Aquimarina litoralis]